MVEVIVTLRLCCVQCIYKMVAYVGWLLTNACIKVQVWTYNEHVRTNSWTIYLLIGLQLYPNKLENRAKCNTARSSGPSLGPQVLGFPSSPYEAEVVWVAISIHEWKLCHLSCFLLVAITFTFSSHTESCKKELCVVHLKAVILNYRLVTMVADIAETVV